ncbi:MAG TPA: SCO family protein [Dissulfurispiraceae bacterium]|nr:SCO family protein [Dissulfurispiraceae bacterium]
MFLICVILFIACLFGAAPASSAPLKANTVNVKVHDLDVLTQDGKRMKFKSDVVGDRIIAMTFTYTTCTTICPVLDAIFVQLQDLLGKKLGKEVSLVTMSIDPVTDIPPRMKQ